MKIDTLQAVDVTAQCLTFALGDEVFAMDIRTVREFIQPKTLPKPLEAA